MAHIPKDKWTKNTFARCKSFCDVLRDPIENYVHLAENEKQKLRQTQVEEQELIQILGFQNQHALIMKWDNVVGWLSVQDFELDNKALEMIVPISKKQSPVQFFECWKGTPYVWGGATRAGIDCSGLTQKYYLDVHDKVLPKNSKDQRRSAKLRPIAEIQDHDLVFCYRLNGSEIHHVGVFFKNEVWHAQLERGVISQGWIDFNSKYKVEEVASYL